MTGTLCAALARIVAMIAAFFGIMFQTILSMVEKAGNTLSRPASIMRLAGFGAAPARITESAGNHDIFPSAPGLGEKGHGVLNQKGKTGKESQKGKTRRVSEQRLSPR